MIRILLLLILLISYVNMEMQKFHHHVYIAGNSRSNSMPVTKGYFYSQMNDQPGTMASYGSSGGIGYDSSEFSGRVSDFPLMDYSKSMESNVPSNMLPFPYLEGRSLGSDEAKMDYQRSKLESELDYERMKSLMRYDSSADKDLPGYKAMGNSFHLDEDDVRSSSRNYYESWPFSYGPYDNDVIKENEKRKDKRNSYNDGNRVIPVYEDSIDIDETARYNRGAMDNPVRGDKPFFSFVLSDYFDKNYDQDPLTFKGIDDWGKTFDSSKPKWGSFNKENNSIHGKQTYHSIDDDGVNTKLKSYRIPIDSEEATNLSTKLRITNIIPEKPNKARIVNKNQSNQLKVKDKGFEKVRSSGKHETNNENATEHKLASQMASQNYGGFKDFADKFANKFGKNDQNKKSDFHIKVSQDKGEKKKGFRRVYHKNEFQEDDEFYDNTSKKAHGEESGSTDFHNKDIHAYTTSHSTANLGEKAEGNNEFANKQQNSNEKNYKRRENSKGSEKDLVHYRDVAKKTAEGNDEYNDYYKLFDA